MLFLYSMLLLLLALIKFVVDRRVSRLERKYSQSALAVTSVLQESNFKPGNSNKHDLCKAASRYYTLGRLVQQRDRYEAKFFTWQRWSDRFAYCINGLRNWKGKKLPYTLGALDVWLLMYLVDQLGFCQYVSLKHAVDHVLTWFAN